jgi:hypothetical protein
MLNSATQRKSMVSAMLTMLMLHIILYRTITSNQPTLARVQVFQYIYSRKIAPCHVFKQAVCMHTCTYVWLDIHALLLVKKWIRLWSNLYIGVNYGNVQHIPCSVMCIQYKALVQQTLNDMHDPSYTGNHYKCHPVMSSAMFHCSGWWLMLAQYP